MWKDGAVRKKIDVHENEVGKLLKGPEMRAVVSQGVRAIAAAAGPGMVAAVTVNRTRVRGTVTTATMEARTRQARSQALTRAIDAGRQ